jgi:hypothetical protein
LQNLYRKKYPLEIIILYSLFTKELNFNFSLSSSLFGIIPGFEKDVLKQKVNTTIKIIISNAIIKPLFIVSSILYLINNISFNLLYFINVNNETY